MKTRNYSPEIKERAVRILIEAATDKRVASGVIAFVSTTGDLYDYLQYSRNGSLLLVVVSISGY